METEGRYAPLELECLAIEWAIRKCKLYLLSSNFMVKTDHRPLVGIFKKRDTENLRLQRIMAKVDNYCSKVEYIQGKRNEIADALSRYPVSDPTEEDLAILACLNKELDESIDPLIKEVLETVDDDYRKIVRSI